MAAAASSSSSSAATATLAAPAAAPAAPPPPPPPPVDKPAHDVVAGAMARAASQSTIHPLDTMKVRMQAGSGSSGGGAASSSSSKAPSLPPRGAAAAQGLERRLSEVRGLYKVSARAPQPAELTAGGAGRCRWAWAVVAPPRALPQELVPPRPGLPLTWLPRLLRLPACPCRAWWGPPRARASSSAPTLPSTPPPSASCASAPS